MSIERPISKETIVTCLCAIILSVLTSVISSNVNYQNQNAARDVSIAVVEERQNTYDENFIELKQMVKETYLKVIEIDKKIDQKADK